MIIEKFTKIFNGVCAKRLSLVEVDGSKSNQHEFNGVDQMKKIFGHTRIDKIPSKFLYLNDNENDSIQDTGFLTWYDAREHDIKRSEFRLYFSTMTIINKAEPGDLLIIARRADSLEVLVIVAKKDSTIENQIIWLFSFGRHDLEKFFIVDLDQANIKNLDFPSEYILEKLGVEISIKEDSLSTHILETYKQAFPDTQTFSNDIYQHLLKKKLINLIDSPDSGVTLLLQTEEIYFKMLEKIFVQQKIEKGFKNVEDFITYSLSIQNRRKSRAGYAFEHNIERLFIINKIKYNKNKVTENRSKPDFIFPGIIEYMDPAFNQINLTMLGVKTTCKDRWRQILSEADKIQQKHLATLEPSISQNQTDEMENRKVILVLPESIHKSYNEKQKRIIISISEFLSLLKQKNP